MQQVCLRRILTRLRAGVAQSRSLVISPSQPKASQVSTRRREPSQSLSFRMRGLARLGSEHNVEYFVLGFVLPICQLLADVSFRPERTIRKAAYCQYIAVCGEKGERHVGGSLSYH
jgi:hypothetical protein